MNRTNQYARLPMYNAPRLNRAAHQKESGYKDVRAMNSSSQNFQVGGVTLLNSIAQGPSVSERIGKKVVLTSVQVRGTVLPGANPPSNGVAKVTWMIVYDRHPKAGLPSVNDLIDNSPGPATGYSDMFTKDDNTGRFRIVRRKDYICTGTQAAPTDLSAYSIDEWTQLRQLEVEYMSAGTGAIGDIQTGALYLVWFSNETAVGTATGDIYTRVRFKDI